MKNKASAANGRLGGRPPKRITEKKPDRYGRVIVRIDPATEMVIPVDAETRALAQRLMLNDYPGVERVEQLFAYAVRRLAN